MALEQVLSGSAPASLVVLRGDRPWSLVREMLARSTGPTLAIMVLHSPSVLGEQAHRANVTTLDLSGAVPGYSDSNVADAITNAVASIPPNATVLIDAADVLADDLGSNTAFRLVRRVLSALSSAPARGRLILSLPPSSPFTSSVLSASLSPSLALLTPLSPRVVQATSTTYLLPADDDRLLPLLEAAALRHSPLSSLPPASAAGEGIVVLVLLRKATGGAKGIVRSVEGLVPSAQSVGRGGETSPRWKAVSLGDVVEVQPQLEAKGTSHADLNLPFNLSLTDSQRAARGAVPLPYAHEGEGADLSMGMDWSDDEEDEEI